MQPQKGPVTFHRRLCKVKLAADSDSSVHIKKHSPFYTGVSGMRPNTVISTDLAPWHPARYKVFCLGSACSFDILTSYDSQHVGEAVTAGPSGANT